MQSSQKSWCAAITISIVFIGSLLPAQSLPDDRFHNMIGFYIDEARAHDHKALLLFDLSYLVADELRQRVTDKDIVVKSTEELISTYPSLPSQNQRYLAHQMLKVGNTLLDASTSPSVDADKSAPAKNSNLVVHFNEPSTFTDPALGNKLIGCVVDADKHGLWPTNELLTTALEVVAENRNLDAKVKAVLKNIPTYKASPQSESANQLVSELTSLTDTALANASVVQKRVPWKKHQFSWERYQPKQPDTTKKSDRSTATEHFLPYKIVARGEVEQIRERIRQLRILYCQLPELEQYDLCVSILYLTSKLLSSNLERDAEALFRTVFASIKIGWLENGLISGGMLSNQSFYSRTFQLEKAKAVITKVIALESAGNFDWTTEISHRMLLGDTCDMLKQRNEAQQQYLLIEKRIDDLYKRRLLDQESYAITRKELDVRLRKS